MNRPARFLRLLNLDRVSGKERRLERKDVDLQRAGRDRLARRAPALAGVHGRRPAVMAPIDAAALCLAVSESEVKIVI